MKRLTIALLALLIVSALGAYASAATSPTYLPAVWGQQHPPTEPPTGTPRPTLTPRAFEPPTETPRPTRTPRPSV